MAALSPSLGTFLGEELHTEWGYVLAVPPANFVSDRKKTEA